MRERNSVEAPLVSASPSAVQRVVMATREFVFRRSNTD
jgi:hypothetical protein